MLIAMFLGAVTGCVLTMTLATAAINHWHEWMMRKVRYWQAEADRYRETLEILQPESGCERHIIEKRSVVKQRCARLARILPRSRLWCVRQS